MSLERDATDWDARRLAARDIYTDVTIQQGAEAYAARQAAYRRGLKLKFQNMWSHGDTPAATEDEGKEHDDGDSAVLISYVAANGDDNEDSNDEEGSDWSDDE